MSTQHKSWSDWERELLERERSWEADYIEGDGDQWWLGDFLCILSAICVIALIVEVVR